MRRGVGNLLRRPLIVDLGQDGHRLLGEAQGADPLGELRQSAEKQGRRRQKNVNQALPTAAQDHLHHQVRVRDREAVALGREPTLEARLRVGGEEELAQTLGQGPLHHRVGVGLRRLPDSHGRRGPREPLAAPWPVRRQLRGGRCRHPRHQRSGDPTHAEGAPVEPSEGSRTLCPFDRPTRPAGRLRMHVPWPQH